MAAPDQLVWELDADTAGKLTKFNHVGRPTEGKVYRLRGMGWHGYGSPVVHAGAFLYHHEGALFSVLEAATGKWRFTKVLKDGKYQCGGGVYPSLTVAGEYVFATGSGGVTFVLRISDYEVVAVN